MGGSVHVGAAEARGVRWPWSWSYRCLCATDVGAGNQTRILQKSSKMPLMAEPCPPHIEFLNIALEIKVFSYG